MGCHTNENTVKSGSSVLLVDNFSDFSVKVPATVPDRGGGEFRGGAAMGGVIGTLSRPLCHFLGYVYPAYQTFKAVQSPNKDTHAQWLTFWIVNTLVAVVGDTFPVGCAYSDKIVFPEYFEDNPDKQNAELQTPLGIYDEGCGLDKVMLSWGHDEYIYHVTKDHLPVEAQYMLRYHSFYPWHREGEYRQLTNAQDREMLKWVLEFNRYDLYTKSHEPPDVEALKPYYEDLIAEFFPAKLRW